MKGNQQQYLSPCALLFHIRATGPEGCDCMASRGLLVSRTQAHTSVARFTSACLQVGPEGCGKNTLLEYCFKRIMGVAVAVVHCSAQTSAANVIQKLVQVRGMGPCDWFRERP